MQRRPSHRYTTSPASSPRTNPHRSNNDRDRDDQAYSLGNTMSSGTGRSSGDVSESEEVSQTSDERLEQEQKRRQRLNNIVQQFFLKGALVIAGSRVAFPPWHKNGQLKQNRWFNVVLNDSEELFSDLLDWKALDVLDARPDPLIIETYLDSADLTPSQTLVILDGQGQRWDVAEALNPRQAFSSPRPPTTDRATDVILERWRLELGESAAAVPSEALYDLPNSYKKAVVLFRSLFTFARTMPAWKYYRRMAKNPPNNPALRIKHRILYSNTPPRGRDLLEAPLISETGSVTQNYVFEPSLSPVGPFCISVTYRDKCDFRVDDSESLLSSHFMASDDQYFRPSLSLRRGDGRGHELAPGSLPARRQMVDDAAAQTQAYGSLSTFHGQIQSGTSPITALRNAQWPGAGSSPNESPPQKLPPNHRTAQGSKSSLRSIEGAGAPPYQRRPSVSFQPFKQGSLASSPASGAYMPVPPSPSSSLLGRDRMSSLNPLAQGGQPTSVPTNRNRNSLTNFPQQALRAPINIPNETAIASSASSSPKPAPISRYSSSFSGRRNRFSSASAGTGTGGSNSRTEDGDPSAGNNSSGKGSVSSSIRDTSTPEVGGLSGGPGGSSGSMQEADDQNLQAFIKLLESKKELRSFNRSDSIAREANITRTTAALNRYQRMRDSNAHLSDSLSSSLVLRRSSSTSSRQLSAVPVMIADRVGSFESSSPSKPVSPHTPHTPAVSSRLSAGALVYEDGGEARSSRSGGRSSSGVERRDDELTTDADTDANRHATTNAIPIPTLPNARAWIGRRSSSVAQRNRLAVVDDADMAELYGLRSSSLPADEARPDVSISELLRDPVPARPPPNRRLANSSESRADADAAGDGPSSETPSDREGVGMAPRAGGGSRWRVQSSAGSAPGQQQQQTTTAAAAAAAGPGVARGSRFSFSARQRKGEGEEEDDEPFMFTMSEIGGASRRSIEDGRAGASLVAQRGRGGGGAGAGGGGGRGLGGGHWGR